MQAKLSWQSRTRTMFCNLAVIIPQHLKLTSIFTLKLSTRMEVSSVSMGWFLLILKKHNAEAELCKMLEGLKG